MFIIRINHSQEARLQQIRETPVTVIKMQLHMHVCWRMSCWVLALKTWRNNKVMLLTHSIQHYCQKKREIFFRLLPYFLHPEFL